MQPLRYFVLISTFVVVACTPGSSGPGNSNNNGAVGVDAGAGNCPQTIVTAPTMPACAKATQTCVTACMDETCADNCFAMEPKVEECLECIDVAYTACVTAAGCQAEYDAVQCCVAGCADPDADDCYNVTCAAQNTAYDTCTSAKGEACDDAICFSPT